MDLLGDDIEIKNRELANWIKDNKLYKDRNELLELEDSIRDEQSKIKAIKSID